MSILKRIILFTSFSFISLSAHAINSVLTQCNNCVYSSEYESIAKYVADEEGHANVYVFIVNLEREELRKYQVVTIKSFEPGVADIRNVVSQHPSSEEFAAFNDMLVIHQELINSLQYKTDIPSEDVGVDSAYDLSGSSSARNKVSDYLVNTRTYIEKTGDLLASAAQISGTMQPFPIIFKVEFDDGSSAYFQALVSVGDSLPLTLIKAVDADGNEIPLNQEQFRTSQSYQWTEQGQAGVDRFMAAASRNGVAVVFDGTAEEPIETNCVGNSSGGLTCTIVTKAK
ncbi:hypothetical protein E2K93_04505 [Thalassotalea sp. HSM 43]|uniref:hypothetical protein n=1 Tax=Thalassotalea sp. HSM 43 TaxID=2552945 RepID=UPI00107FE987|nr:hypothetical protein [Thalassotalea sp. HSM 43]QBY03686.1 hypothetical protein E2K93_04505 [Thalassotalea sp. HSM 43]